MARRARYWRVHSDVTQEVNFIEGKKRMCPCGVAKVKERSTAVFRVRYPGWPRSGAYCAPADGWGWSGTWATSRSIGWPR